MTVNHDVTGSSPVRGAIKQFWKGLLFSFPIAFMGSNAKWHRINGHCLLRKRLLICYSSVGHDEWRNVAWCHRITDGNLAVPSSGSHNGATILHPNTKVLDFQGLFLFLGVKSTVHSPLHLFPRLYGLESVTFLSRSAWQISILIW